MDVMLRPVGLGRIGGLALGRDGPVRGAVVALEPVEGGPAGSVTSVTRSDGAFTFAGLLPGTYVLRGMTRPVPPVGSVNGPVLLASTRILVQPASTQNVVLAFAESRTLSGVVRLPEHTASVSQISVTARPRPGPDEALTIPRTVRLDSQGTFKLDGLFPGVHVVDVAGIPPGQQSWKQ